MIKLIENVIELIKKIKNILIRYRVSSRLNKKNIDQKPKNQILEIYWDKKFRNDLDYWGKDNVWIEIKYLLVNKRGKVLDICCGTGGTIRELSEFKNLDIFGFDISEYLIESARKSGISDKKLRVLNATKTDYKDNEFDYSYSIGSLEHFTIEGIDAFLKETKRITKKATFHQIPTAKDEKFRGWLDLDQSYFNMEEEWWLPKFKKYYENVYVIKSFWNDSISNGRWFICF